MWAGLKKLLDQRTGVQNWTLHDIRRTFATLHARLGTPIHITERLLNHVSGTLGGIVAIYQRHGYESQMREAMTNYEAAIMRLEKGNPFIYDATSGASSAGS